MIPEAAVEAAAKALSAQDMRDFHWDSYMPDAHAALEAAAPHMLAPVIEVADRLAESTLSGNSYLTGRRLRVPHRSSPNPQRHRNRQVIPEAAPEGEGDYRPSWDDRKELASLWQDHASLPVEGLSEAVYDALIAVATWGYRQRKDEEQ